LQSHPTTRLLVVGEGFFGEEEKLKVEAARLGLQDNVVITGRVAEEDVPAYLSMGDVALYPIEDNLITRAKSPVKVLEPMLMGLPIVAHRVGQAAEFIGDAGVLVEPGNLLDMADAVSALLSDPARRKRIGEKARERVWAEFNWEKLCLEAEKAYKVALPKSY
jgi:glycosyltransferase involved in cell wall biosynthesis